MTIGTWLAACALLVAAVACGESAGSGGDGAGGSAQGGAGGEGGHAQGGAGGGGGSAHGGAGGEGGVAQGGSGGEPAPFCTPGAVQACYSGPAGSRGVGACVDGLQSCLPDGSAFGPCEGERTPAAESCATAEDDDCSGVANEGCLCVPGATSACYDGPVGTEGIGACLAGVQRCADDGLSLLPCEGQSLPGPAELCGNFVDDDCDGQTDLTMDVDGDGFERCGGDCCDDPSECANPRLVNPLALELPTAPGATPQDDDCDGLIDEVDACDVGFAIDDVDPLSATAALGLCGAPAGVVSAEWVGADGRALPPDTRAGLLPDFGPNVPPRAGSTLLALSSGAARRVADPGACGSRSCASHAGTPPEGFPQAAPGCAVSPFIHDDVGLRLTLRVPPNAVAIAFDHRFYSFEYPEWRCSDFNDEFVALINPPALWGPNVAFDATGNVVTVNSPITACDGCVEGLGPLAGTGFDVWDDAGATAWTTSTAEVWPGSTITLHFTIWDTGDANFDSTVLIDDLRWIAAPQP